MKQTQSPGIFGTLLNALSDALGMHKDNPTLAELQQVVTDLVGIGDHLHGHELGMF